MAIDPALLERDEVRTDVALLEHVDVDATVLCHRNGLSMVRPALPEEHDAVDGALFEQLRHEPGPVFEPAAIRDRAWPAIEQLVAGIQVNLGDSCANRGKSRRNAPEERPCRPLQQ